MCGWVFWVTPGISRRAAATASRAPPEEVARRWGRCSGCRSGLLRYINTLHREENAMKSVGRTCTHSGTFTYFLCCPLPADQRSSRSHECRRRRWAEVACTHAVFEHELFVPTERRSCKLVTTSPVNSRSKLVTATQIRSPPSAHLLHSPEVAHSAQESCLFRHDVSLAASAVDVATSGANQHMVYAPMKISVILRAAM